MSHNSLRWDVSVGGCTKKERMKERPGSSSMTSVCKVWVPPAHTNWAWWAVTDTASLSLDRKKEKSPLSFLHHSHTCLETLTSPPVSRQNNLTICGTALPLRVCRGQSCAKGLKESGDVQRGPSWGPCANRESGNGRPVTAAVCQQMDGSAFCSWHERVSGLWVRSHV